MAVLTFWHLHTWPSVWGLFYLALSQPLCNWPIERKWHHHVSWRLSLEPQKRWETNCLVKRKMFSNISFPFPLLSCFSSMSNHLFFPVSTFCVKILVNIFTICFEATFVWSTRKICSFLGGGGLHSKIIRYWKGRSSWTHLTAGNRFDWLLHSGDRRFWTCCPSLEKIWGHPQKTEIVLLQGDTSAIPPAQLTEHEWMKKNIWKVYRICWQHQDIKAGNAGGFYSRVYRSSYPGVSVICTTGPRSPFIWFQN